MKTAILAVLAAGLSFATAAEKIKTPNGGRLVEAVKPRAEFLVTPDKKIEVRFLDESGKVVPPAEQVVTVTMGDRANPTKLAFAKDGDKLVSDKTIPDAKEQPVVLQIKPKEGEKALTVKFTLNLAKCPNCEHAEYACTCEPDDGHTHKEGDGHKHKEGDGHKH